MKFHPHDCITILGTRGTGKSTLARKIKSAWPRHVILDPVNDWTDGEIVFDFNEFAKKLAELKKNNSRNFSIIFRFNPDLKEREHIYDHVLRLCFHFKDLQIITDEVQLFASTHKLPNYLGNTLFIGRHNALSKLSITQRPGQLNKNILSQSQHVFVGQLHEKNDLQVVAEFLNVPKEKIINLKKGHFLWFRPGEEIQEINIFAGKK